MSPVYHQFELAKTVTWAAGYLIALAWGWLGALLFDVIDYTGDSGLEGFGLLLLLLLWVASPVACSLVARRRNRQFRHPLLGGLAFGGATAAAYLLLIVALLFTGLGGIFFAGLLTHPIGVTLFFTVPPLWFGWIYYLHKTGVRAATMEATSAPSAPDE